jgi:hypothetical protein
MIIIINSRYFIELINRLKNVGNIINNTLFKKNTYETNFKNMLRFFDNSHFCGANSLTDWMLGIISYKERIKALINNIYLLIILIRSVILYTFNNNEWICIAFGEIFYLNNRIVHCAYITGFSGFICISINFLMDYKIMRNEPILSETLFKLENLNRNSMFKKKYKEKFYIVIKYCSIIQQMAANSTVIGYSILYGIFTYNAYTNNGNNHWILILLFWFIINIKSFYIICRIAFSSAFLQINIAFTCKYKFQQICDEIRELSKCGLKMNGNNIQHYLIKIFLFK